jgi:hypothetical protein
MNKTQLREFRKSIKRVRAKNAGTPEKARRFLQEEGVLTSSGRLTDRYRAKL